MTDFIQASLAKYFEVNPVVYDSSAWASRLLACPRQHAHERRQDKPTYPELLAHSPELQRLFQLGHEAQEFWFQVLSLSYPCRREVPVRAKGVTGRIDILLRDSVSEGYEDVPIEIKFTQVSDPSHLWQLAAYMYAGNYQNGWLIRDRGREQEVVHLDHALIQPAQVL